jgi:hypothetical protein
LAGDRAEDRCRAADAKPASAVEPAFEQGLRGGVEADEASAGLASYAGQTVVVFFNVHDDGYPSDPSSMLVDDVSVQ